MKLNKTAVTAIFLQIIQSKTTGLPRKQVVSTLAAKHMILILPITLSALQAKGINQQQFLLVKNPQK